MVALGDRVLAPKGHFQLGSKYGKIGEIKVRRKRAKKKRRKKWQKIGKWQYVINATEKRFIGIFSALGVAFFEDSGIILHPCP